MKSVEDIGFMFFNCNSISLDIGGFITGHIEAAETAIHIFNILSCEKLEVVKMPANLRNKVSLPGSGWKDENGKTCYVAEVLPVPMIYTRILTTNGGGAENPGSLENQNSGGGNSQDDTAVFTDSKNFGQYMVTSSDTVTYVGFDNRNAKSVTIPDQVTNGKGIFKVTAIADGVFKGNKKIASVTIGKM